MRERLYELIVDAENAIYREKTYITDSERIEKIADYLLSNEVIVPPCKVGDTVYHIRRTPKRHGGSYIVEAKVNSILIETHGKEYHIDCFVEYTNHRGDTEEEYSIFGKTGFRTRAEAEKALAKMNKEGKG